MKKVLTQNKKLAILIIAIVLLGFLFFLIKSFFFNKKIDEALKILFDTEKPIAFKQDDLYGFMNSKGEKIIPAKYKKAGTFYNGYAAVQTDDNIYEFIDIKSETKETIQTDVEPKYLTNYRTWLAGNKIYNDKLEVVFEGNFHLNYIDYGFFEFMDNEKNSSGIVDHTGKIIFQWDQDYIQVKIPQNDFQKNGYYALISNYEENEKIISLQTGKEIFSLEDAKNMYIREEKDNIFRIIDREDSFKTKTWFYISDDKIAYKSNEAIYSISLLKHDDDILEIDYGPTYKNQNLEKQYVYYNVKTGKSMDEPTRIDEVLLDNTYGYHTTICDKLYGINKGYKENTECIYDEIKFPEVNLFNYLKSENKEHIVLLKNGSNTILYNMKKKKTIETFENSAASFNTSSTFMTITQYEEDGFTKKNILMYNLLTHKSKQFNKDSEILIGSNYVFIDGKYYNTNLELILE